MVLLKRKKKPNQSGLVLIENLQTRKEFKFFSYGLFSDELRWLKRKAFDTLHSWFYILM